MSAPPKLRDGAWARIRRDRSAMIGLSIIVLVHLVAIASPLIATQEPSEMGPLVEGRLLSPSTEHLLGTDRLSRDVFSRLLYSSRVSLIVASVSVVIAVLIGTLWGAISGYAGGKIDALMMRTVDTFLAFPAIILLMTIVGLWQTRSPWVIAIIIGLMTWMRLARLVRAQFLSIKERDFFLAARSLGAGPWHLITRHLLPHATNSIIVFATLHVGDMILLEAGLSYLGLSVNASETPSWGHMIFDNRQVIWSHWWIPLSAGLAVVFTVAGYNLLGDGLRDALDPKHLSRTHHLRDSTDD